MYYVSLTCALKVMPQSKFGGPRCLGDTASWDATWMRWWHPCPWTQMGPPCEVQQARLPKDATSMSSGPCVVSPGDRHWPYTLLWAPPSQCPLAEQVWVELTLWVGLQCPPLLVVFLLAGLRQPGCVHSIPGPTFLPVSPFMCSLELPMVSTLRVSLRLTLCFSWHL